MSDFILNKEGITHGDPFSMYVYAIGILLSIQSFWYEIHLLVTSD